MEKNRMSGLTFCMADMIMLAMYEADGEHATAAGSEFAAKYIWYAIQRDLYEKGKDI